mgnify:CR=1 FL=1
MALSLSLMGQQLKLGKKAAKDAAKVGYRKNLDLLHKERMATMAGLDEDLNKLNLAQHKKCNKPGCQIMGGRKSRRKRRKGQKSRKH